MAKNLEQLTRQVLSRLNETDDSFVNRDDIRNYLNEALDDLTDALRVEAPPAAITLIEDVDEYDIPENLNRFARVELEGTRLIFNEFKTFNEIQQDNTYTVWGDKLYIRPIPTSAEAGQTLKVYYYRKPSHMEHKDDKADIDGKYDQFLILYALAKAFERDEELELFSSTMQQYEAKKNEMVVNRDIKLEREVYRSGDMNLRQMINAVRYRGQMYDKALVTDDDIKDFINEAQNDLVDILRLEADPPHTDTLAEDQQAYDLPEDFNKMERLEVEGERYIHQDYLHFSEKPIDKSYTFWEDKVLLYPIPEDSGEQLKIHYYRRFPELINDDDVSELDVKYRKTLLMYALARAFEKRGDGNNFSSLMQQYEHKKAEMVAFRYVREEEEYAFQEKWYW